MLQNPSSFTDEELMASLTSPSRTWAFEELINRYGKKLLNFFVRSGVRYDAEDLVQQTFLRLYRYRGRYEPTAKFSTFIFLLARQTWIDELRRMKKRQRTFVPMDDGFAESVPSDGKAPCEEHDARHDILKALECLSDPLRQVVVLGAIEDLSYSQIAEILSIPEGTVKSRMFNALAKMRRYLEKDGE